MRKLTAAVLALVLTLLSGRAIAANSTLVTQENHPGFTSLNINSAGSDNAVAIPYAKYIVRRVTVYNASTSLGASASTLGLFTAASGGGTTVVTAALLTTLTSASVSMDMTILTGTTALTGSTLYLRNVLAHGSAATVDVTIEIEPLL